MRTSLRRDLTAALKNRDRVAVTALRSVLAAIENAEATPLDQRPGGGGGAMAVGVGATEVDRLELSDTDVRAIVAREVSERSAGADQYDQLGREDVASRLRAEADVLSRYLDTEHHR